MIGLERRLGRIDMSASVEVYGTVKVIRPLTIKISRATVWTCHCLTSNFCCKGADKPGVTTASEGGGTPGELMEISPDTRLTIDRRQTFWILSPHPRISELVPV